MSKREALCVEPKAIENDLVKELDRLYRGGTDFRAFWEVIQLVYLFSQPRRNNYLPSPRN